MINLSSTAMILAAGLGTRMRPLSLKTPKPLLKVGGQTMLDHALDKLKAAGIKRAVVNTYYLADQIEQHLKSRQDIDIVISRETELLDTGGGIKNARRHLGDNPFFVLNADLCWFDGPSSSLTKMAQIWNPEIMDQLLLVMPTHKARGFSGKGDFMLNPDGHLWRQNAPIPRTHVWISAQIMKPRLLDEVQEKVFSNNKIFDTVESNSKLSGLVHEGTCFHTGTPEDLAEANRLLATGQGWATP